MEMLLGYLGPEGTYSEEAAYQYAVSSADSGSYLLRPYPAIDGIFTAIAGKEIDRGVVPVENCLEGSVNLTLDLLSRNTDTVKIRGESLCRIEHFLLARRLAGPAQPAQLDQPARPGQRPAVIEEIYSHPQALAQCRAFLDRHYPGAARISISSTAEAAALVARQVGKTAGMAAIASRQAAALYGLEVLRANIQDEPYNITRFLILATQDAAPSGDDKTSLLIGLPDQPGSLHAALGIFAAHNLNLTKIESRPIRGELGKYIFFLDIEGHRKDENVAGALQAIKEKALFLKILGSYPRAVSS